MKITESTQELLEEAQRIKVLLVEIRKEVFDYAKQKYPHLKYKNYNGLYSGFKNNNLPIELLRELEPKIKNINSLKELASAYIEKRDKIIENIRETPVSTILLNPKVDPIPSDTYPKLNKNCAYPLRGACNSGENSNSFWARCEYMKYDNSESPFSNQRWKCEFKE